MNLAPELDMKPLAWTLGITAILLTACGGGGGSIAGTESTSGVTGLTTPPQVPIVSSTNTN